MERDQRRPARRRRPPRGVGGAALVALVAAAAVGSCSQAATGVHRPPPIVAVTTDPAGVIDSPASTAPPATAAAVASVLAGLPRGTPAVAAGVATALAPAVAAAALGKDPGIVVLDPRTAAVLVAADASVGAAPASTAKLLTATAVLDRWGPTHRFTTSVLLTGHSGAVAHLVVVGGGDPSLTAATEPARGGGAGGGVGAGAGDEAVDPVADPARLSALVARTVADLRASGTREVSVAVEDSLFGGPVTSPRWRSSYVADGFVGPVDALSLDDGRIGPDTVSRVTDPGLTAGRAFAAGLGAAGLTVDAAVTRTAAPLTGSPVASVESPRLVDLVRHLLLASDNDYGETLLRQVATGVPGAAAGTSGTGASFAASTAAVLARLSGMGIDTTGVVLFDGSGLARDDRVPPLVLARVLATDLGNPALAGVARSLPVAGESGTLSDRFTGAAAVGRGRVFAKTGTLSGVDDLAGYVVSRSAGPLVVVVLAGDTAGAVAAEGAIDLLVSRVVRCGCHR